MKRIIKHTLLNYIPDFFQVENDIRQERIFEVNKKPIKAGNIIYLMERELRLRDNFALNYAIKESKKLNKNLQIFHKHLNFETELKKIFYKQQLKELQKDLTDFDFKIINDFDFQNLKPAMLIIDFNPILKRSYLKNFDCKIVEIDSHNIIPARFVSKKQEYNAATFRRKVYHNIYEFLNEFPKINSSKTTALQALDDFIENRLPLYARFKNDPLNDVTSHLSKYLNLGFLSAQRAAIEVIKSEAADDNKEIFLEELIVRSELCDNFCLYCKNFKSFSCIANWAKETLLKHANDFRAFVYSKEFEEAATNDKLWNLTQLQLVKTGKIHGYLRMYWAKKILEWSINPTEALKIAVYLNDKYALDAPSANGYSAILWSIAGLHDRAFMERPIIGKIRPMTCRKFKNFDSF